MQSKNENSVFEKEKMLAMADRIEAIERRLNNDVLPQCVALLKQLLSHNISDRNKQVINALTTEYLPLTAAARWIGFKTPTPFYRVIKQGKLKTCRLDESGDPMVKIADIRALFETDSKLPEVKNELTAN